MSLDILKFPDPRLKKISAAVTRFDESLHGFLEEMAETMYAANGVGLAAPQVNQAIRVFIIDISSQDEKHKKLYEFINPTLRDGEGKIVYEEGCLSVPGIAEQVQRKSKMTVDYFDRHGKPHILKAEDLLAVAVQHENDHLDGILFIDRLSPLKRRLVKRKISKVITL